MLVNIHIKQNKKLKRAINELEKERNTKKEYIKGLEEIKQSNEEQIQQVNEKIKAQDTQISIYENIKLLKFLKKLKK